MPEAKENATPSANDKLKINVNATDRPYESADMEQKRREPRRLQSYFIVLIDQGAITYQLDLQEITLTEGDLLFAMPNQIFTPPVSTDVKYFKVLFDETTLALLPQRFSFLVNPLHTQTITLPAAARQRVRTIFETLNELLHTAATDSEIILAYLHLLLAELNNAYFKNEPANTLNSNVKKFVEFKVMVETHLKEQPTIHTLAERLALTENSLYRLVKEHTGTSPKDFVTNRLMLEAQRRLLHSAVSVKELAYELGFNDPDYFSRLFKKTTGQSVSEFMTRKDL